MHLSKLPSGHWRVAVKYRGQRKTATATTRTEARLLGHELELELQTEVDRDAKTRPRDVTVADLAVKLDNLTDLVGQLIAELRHDTITGGT